MGSRNHSYTLIYRGEFIQNIPDGQWVIIQCLNKKIDGFWFGRAYSDCFWLEFERPSSLPDALSYIHSYDEVSAKFMNADEFTLE